MDYPHDVEYHEFPEGRSIRTPRGKISRCPTCGRNGLRLVSAWSKGRYSISYWHVGIKLAPGDTIAHETCSISSRTLAGLPKSEREKGRFG